MQAASLGSAASDTIPTHVVGDRVGNTHQPGDYSLSEGMDDALDAGLEFELETDMDTASLASIANEFYS